jgi:hypothetical protein
MRLKINVGIVLIKIYTKKIEVSLNEIDRGVILPLINKSPYFWGYCSNGNKLIIDVQIKQGMSDKELSKKLRTILQEMGIN